MKVPAFADDDDYARRLTDIAFWRPWVAQVLQRHRLDSSAAVEAGVGPTYPTFLAGDVVVKFFGFRHHWPASFDAEGAIHERLAGDRAILAPRTLATGDLGDNAWRYRVTTRMGGVPWEDAKLAPDDQRRIAAELGAQVARVQRLAGDGLVRHEDWSTAHMREALARSSLPAPLHAEVDDFLASIGPFDRVVVHGDLMVRHVFVDDGRLAGLIDWGDAMVTDRHYELAKLHLDLFDGDRTLLGSFLKAAEWPVRADFPRRALALSLHRQAHGVVQHDRMDVFHKLETILDGRRVDDLASLADALFAV